MGRRAYSVYDIVESRDVKWLFILRVSSVFEEYLQVFGLALLEPLYPALSHPIECIARDEVY